ncbi:copper transporter-like protein [Dinothrombium tinctorium]|uniref:Copper transport protein n=1 Tax=Dinothrombium tinctorium TaxID=1965070 RepID=A0A443R2Q8_9ACAR|nr:copper transporter-like protein [Dinothrombium tinctorium]
MAACFRFGYPDCFLFKQLAPKNALEMTLLSLLVSVIAATYEYLRAYRERLFEQQHSTFSLPLLPPTHNNVITPNYLLKRIFKREHLMQTALQVCQVFIGYFLMLVAMTFNIWLFISVILGSGFGYFLFANLDAKLITAVNHYN